MASQKSRPFLVDFVNILTQNCWICNIMCLFCNSFCEFYMISWVLSEKCQACRAQRLAVETNGIV